MDWKIQLLRMSYHHSVFHKSIWQFNFFLLRLTGDTSVMNAWTQAQSKDSTLEASHSFCLLLLVAISWFCSPLLAQRNQLSHARIWAFCNHMVSLLKIVSIRMLKRRGKFIVTCPCLKFSLILGAYIVREMCNSKEDLFFLTVLIGRPKLMPAEVSLKIRDSVINRENLPQGQRSWKASESHIGKE